MAESLRFSHAPEECFFQTWLCSLHADVLSGHAQLDVEAGLGVGGVERSTPESAHESRSPAGLLGQ